MVRWKTRPKWMPASLGKIRTVKRFAFLPTRLDDYTTCWLLFYVAVQERTRFRGLDRVGPSLRWVDVERYIP